MANYVKTTNFTTKDSLPSGNSGKIVRGTEIDNEFNAIASAISSKADLNSPALTGTPTAPTAAPLTNTTQLATTAFVRTAITNLNLGTISTQNSNAVTITGGTITGITDLAVADGGTGASSFTQNHLVLGNGTSPLNGNMVAPGANGNLLVSNGTTWVSQTPNYVGHRAQVFTSSGTFTIPTGITALKVTVVGGGGAGNNVSMGTGASGGNSSVSSGTQSISTITGNGGAGGSHQTGGAGGSASGGDLIIGGEDAEPYAFSNWPGCSLFSTGRGVRGYGNGGQGANVDAPYGSGGGGGTAIKWLTGLTPGNTLTVTVGAGGGSGSLAGTAGVVVFEW